MTNDFSKNFAITAKKVTFSIFDEFYTDKSAENEKKTRVES